MLQRVSSFFNQEVCDLNLIHVSSFYNQFPEETELDLLSVTIDGPSHYSPNSEGSCSVFRSPRTPGFSPGAAFQSEDGRRDDSLSSTSEDSEKDEKDEDHEKERFYIYRKPS